MEDAQQEHDRKMMGKKVKLEPDSAEKLEALLAAKKQPSFAQSRPTTYDPINSIVRNHPTLTREQAAKVVEDYGF